MHPIKSVSGITGIGKDCKQMGYQCNWCTDSDCFVGKIKRRKNSKKICEQLQISKGYYLFAVVIFELNTNQANKKYEAC
jgi:hypothetical protein